MLRARIVCAGIAALLALALAAALLPPAPTAAADSGDAITTELRPGLNLAGWTQPETPVAAIFDAIPRLTYVYAWDPDDQWFRWATRTASGVVGDLEVLTPGMGLWLDVGGEEAFAWTRPFIPQTGLASLREGWNLIVWAGDSGVAASYALRHLDGIVAATLNATSREPATLTRGGAFWLKAAAPKQWWQLNDPPRIEFFNEFSPEQKKQFAKSVDSVVAYFAERLGMGISGLIVRFGDDDIYGCGGYGHPRIYLKTGCHAAIAHEYAHAVQAHLGTPAPSPAWIWEGVANRWSAQYYDATGARTYDAHLRDVTVPNARQVTAPLRRMQTYDELLATSGSYSLAHLAVDQLAALAGEDALYDYFARRSEYGTWEEAFRAIFGLTAAAFYEGFENHRAEVAPPHSRIGGVVLGPAGAPAEGITVRVRDAGTGNGFHTKTDADGAFEWRPDTGSYFISLSLGACTLEWSTLDSRLTLAGADRASFVVERDGLTGVVLNLITDPSGLCSRLSGVVRDSALEPVDSADVYLFERTRSGFEFAWGSRVPTDDDGSFSITVSPGRYKIGVSCRGAGDVWYGGEGEVVDFDGARAIRVGADGVGGIVITLPLLRSEIGKRACTPPGAPVMRGRVVGPEGEPLAGVWVGYVGNSDGSPTPFFSVVMARALSDAAGEFALEMPAWPPFIRVFLDQKTLCPSGEALPGAWFDVGKIETDGTFTPARNLPEGLSVDAADAQSILIRFPAGRRC